MTAMRNNAGFTIIEVVITLVVLALLLTVALPRLFDDEQVRLEMAARMIRSDIAAVQRLAVTEGSALEATFSSDGYQIERIGAGTEVTFGGRFPVIDLSDDLGVSITTTGTVSFNSLGEPLAGSLTSLTVNAVSNPALTKQIVVESETGYASVQ